MDTFKRGHRQVTIPADLYELIIIIGEGENRTGAQQARHMLAEHIRRFYPRELKAQQERQA